MDPAVVEEDFNRLVREHSSYWDAINKSVDVISNIGGDDACEQVKRLKYFLRKVSNMEDVQHHWDELKISLEKNTKTVKQAHVKHKEKTSTTFQAQLEHKQSPQKSSCTFKAHTEHKPSPLKGPNISRAHSGHQQPPEKATSKRITRKPKRFSSDQNPPRLRREEISDKDGTNSRPHLVAITEGLKGRLPRFYLRINGAIRILRADTISTNKEFTPICCGGRYSCPAKHRIRIINDSILERRSGATQRLIYNHPELHNISSYQIVTVNTDEHNCNLTATIEDIRGIQLGTIDKKSSTRRKSSIMTVEEPREPVKKRERKSLGVYDRNSLGRPCASKSSRFLALRMTSMESGVPQKGNSITTGECAKCDTQFDGWKLLISHILESPSCRGYYTEEFSSFCFICWRPFQALKCHFYDLLRGKLSYGSDTADVHSEYHSKLHSKLPLKFYPRQNPQPGQHQIEKDTKSSDESSDGLDEESDTDSLLDTEVQ